MSDSFIPMKKEVLVRVPPVYSDCLHGEVFRPDGSPPDGAGLCDGGDYIQKVQIRISDPETGAVYISVQPMERGEWWRLKLPWSDFYAMMEAAVRGHRDVKHNER